MQVPTDMKIGEDKALLVASKYTKQVEIINLKKRKCLGKIKLEETFGVIDFYGKENLLVNFFNSHELTLINEGGNHKLL